jgi:hypothetical protein
MHSISFEFCYLRRSRCVGVESTPAAEKSGFFMAADLRAMQVYAYSATKECTRRSFDTAFSEQGAII